MAMMEYSKKGKITFLTSGKKEKDEQTIELLKNIEERNCRIYGAPPYKIFKVGKLL